MSFKIHYTSDYPFFFNLYHLNFIFSKDPIFQLLGKKRCGNIKSRKIFWEKRDAEEK
jgi:hypothetical protein